MWTINGELFDPNRIAADPQLGTVELWKLRAKSMPHPIHIHLAPFQVVEPGQYATGWKDTVDLNKAGEAEVLVRFDGYRGDGQLPGPLNRAWFKLARSVRNAALDRE